MSASGILFDELPQRGFGLVLVTLGGQELHVTELLVGIGRIALGESFQQLFGVINAALAGIELGQLKLVRLLLRENLRPAIAGWSRPGRDAWPATA